ncbi:hypothetical protein [Methylacidimicrobium sp. B4]|uniref:hypothetical protein n=1 Tax=Methylacidimicrobium sp. B4 TaxID=2796139 RepID=UPI001A8CD77B|nr:hypothetical protein [Methylacidimicrobium sp. B4]QSR84725.1 hypothetical protein MacB4_00065 [Methylacidimicrobium sp. B4]
MKKIVMVLVLALLSGGRLFSATEPATGGDAPTPPPETPPSSWQERLADLLKRDSDLNRKIDQIDQAIRQKHDDLARSLTKELQNERSAFHRDLQQMKSSVQSGIRNAAQSLGKGAGQLKDEAAKLQEALERASKEGAPARAPAAPAEP